jgi:predicted metal-dependent hydrolase
MKNTIALKDIKLEYQHRRLSRSRRVRLAVSTGGKVNVTTPIFFPESKVKEFLLLHADWIIEKIAQFKDKETKSVFPTGHKDFVLNKSKALRLIREKIALLNNIYGFRYNKVTVKNTSSRWGSCAKSGNLNFQLQTNIFTG